MELKLLITISVRTFFQLLIVPYGIETIQKHYCLFHRYLLLIVPYGIETFLYLLFEVNQCTFNCTLWN